MYVSQQMLRVHHDEWMRYVETRRLVSQAKAERPRASRGRKRSQPGLRGLRPGRPVNQA